MSTQEFDLGSVAVIGLGLMGRSIVACLLAAGHRVTGVTNDMAASASVPQHIREPPGDAQRATTTGGRRDGHAAVCDIAELSDAAKAVIVFESVTEDWP